VIFVKGLLNKQSYVNEEQLQSLARKSREENIAEFEAQFYTSRKRRN